MTMDQATIDQMLARNPNRLSALLKIARGGLLNALTGPDEAGDLMKMGLLTPEGVTERGLQVLRDNYYQHALDSIGLVSNREEPKTE